MQHRTGEHIDESSDLDLGAVDVVLSALTLPLLFWVAMYAVTGHERLYATREARLRLYLLLLGIEAVLVTAAAWWFTR